MIHLIANDLDEHFNILAKSRSVVKKFDLDSTWDPKPCLDDIVRADRTIGILITSQKLALIALQRQNFQLAYEFCERVKRSDKVVKYLLSKRDFVHLQPFKPLIMGQNLATSVVIAELKSFGRLDKALAELCNRKVLREFLRAEGLTPEDFFQNPHKIH
jgi:hypothetical protein